MTNGANSHPEAKAGADGHAWGRLQRIDDHHYADLYRCAFRLTGRACDAEDLVQQTFLIAAQKLHQLRRKRKCRAWLMAVLRNEFLRTRRKAGAVALSGLGLEADLIASGSNHSPAADAKQIDSTQLQKALNALTDNYRLILVMHYLEGLSYKQIAAQLEVPLGTVMSRLSRARARLKDQLLAVVEGAAPGNRAPARGVRTAHGGHASPKPAAAPFGQRVSRDPLTAPLKRGGKESVE